MNTGKALLGVAVGIAAGAVLGLLLAPEKGAKTRKNLLGKGENLAHELNKKIDKKFEELMHSISGKVKHALKNDLAKPKAEKMN